MVKAAFFLAVVTLVICAPSFGADLDNDGVPDEGDRCPDTMQITKVDPAFPYAVAVSPERRLPGRQSHPVDEHGCELDSDGDGVKNSADYCPNDAKETLAAGVAKNGCPKHSDGDGTPDYRDRCPGTPRGVSTDAWGCPLS